MSWDAIVVGSGPSGVAAASSLLRHGRRVLMLDAGLRLEAGRERLAEEMAETPPAAWTARQLEQVKEGMEPGPEGIPLKRLFGSDFAFRGTDRFAALACERSELKISLAVGGLSNVWGAGLIPFCADDIADWPIGIADLEAYYRECLVEMDLAAWADDLAAQHPLYTERARPLQLSRQAAALLSDLERHRTGLREEGIAFGASRLAVNATAPGGCLYCGLCLYGCPYGFIYNAGTAVRSLQARAGFEYRADVVVDRVEEKGGSVTLRGRSYSNNEPTQFEGCQVFLACGAISTTAILLDSLEEWNRPVPLKDSQYFLVPVLRFASTPAVEQEALHTLAQLFLEIHDARLSSRGIHMSLYSFNDLLLRALEKQTGFLGRVFPGLPRALARRLLVFGGYLHSQDSPGLELSLTRTQAGGRQIHVRGLEESASRRIISRLMRKLVRNSGRLRAVPLVPLARPGLPGRGFHTGGSFPMAHQPAELQSDLAGRPRGFERVHVVDASVLPSIPAPNLTLTVMANARRIARLTCEG